LPIDRAPAGGDTYPLPVLDAYPVKPARPAVRIGATIVSHSVVDFFSFVPIALMPLLTSRLDLSIKQEAQLIGIGAICSGAVQPVVAWASDRFDTRLFGSAGLALAAICVGLFGWVDHFWQLAVLMATGTMGIGAFHPPSAAAAGHLGGTKRSFVVAAFFLAGMLGGMAGNVFSPVYVEAAARIAGGSETPDYGAGLRALAWLVIPAVLVALVLMRAIRSVGHRHHDAHEKHATLPPRERSARWAATGLLYIGNIVRFTADLSLAFLLIQWSKMVTQDTASLEVLTQQAGAEASTLNGLLQAFKQLGMGVVGLLAGTFLPMRLAKPALVLAPWFGAIAAVSLPYAAHAAPGAERWVGLALAMCAGVGIGSMVPVTIALAQRLLPHRTSLASGMMMGGAWVFAPVGPWIMEVLIAREGVGLDGAFLGLGCILVFAGLLGLLLPGKLIRELPSD